MTATAKHVRLPWYCPEDPFYLALSDGPEKAAAGIVDIFRNTGSPTGLTLRVTVHDLSLGMSHTEDYAASAQDLRQFAQFILRKLKTEADAPATAAHRFYPSKTPDRRYSNAKS